ncbi:MAG: hypothetical protein AB9819_04335 [Methanomassiliicoccales archaeon]
MINKIGGEPLELRKIVAIYCFFIGISMIGMWSVFIATGSVPEIETKPAEIGLHVTAEILTALSLIIGGFGLFVNKSWGFIMYLVASGLLTYTLIASPGYYVTKGEPMFVAMFGVFLALDILFLVLMLKKDGIRDRYGH